MKYGSTSRTLCALFHGILALGGIVLAAYFGFFVLPTHFINATAFVQTYLPLNLKLELAVFGLTGALVSGYGFYQAMKALANPSDDAPVLKSFAAFIVMGYLGAIFFFLNGTVFFGLTAGEENPAFIIVVAIIVAIGLLIAANVPMVRLFDNKNSASMYRGIAYGVSVNAFAITLFSAISLITLLASPNSITANNVIMLVVYVAFSLAVALLCLFCGKLIEKKGQLSGLLGSLAVLTVGAAFATIGGLEIGWGNYGRFHFSSWQTSMNLAEGANSYGIAALIIGAAVAVAGIACLCILYKPWQTEGKKA